MILQGACKVVARFCKVIARLRRALDKAGVVVSIQVKGAREYLGLYSGEDTAGDEDDAKLNDVSFADDLAFVIATQAHLLLDTLRTAALIMWQVYEECGFRLSWGPSKTAAVLKWVGADSRMWRTKVEQ